MSISWVSRSRTTASASFLVSVVPSRGPPLWLFQRSTETHKRRSHRTRFPPGSSSSSSCSAQQQQTGPSSTLLCSAPSLPHLQLSSYLCPATNKHQVLLPLALSLGSITSSSLSPCFFDVGESTRLITRLSILVTAAAREQQHPILVLPHRSSDLLSKQRSSNVTRSLPLPLPPSVPYSPSILSSSQDSLLFDTRHSRLPTCSPTDTLTQRCP